MHRIESTGTVKQVKVQLRLEGVDPTKVTDPLYWLNGGRYTPFRKADWVRRISSHLTRAIADSSANQDAISAGKSVANSSPRRCRR